MSTPLYQVIKQYVLAHVEDGRWAIGDKIPSEHALVKRFNVSRMTANRALKELTSEGVLVRVSGAGTFVAPPRTRKEFLDLRDISVELAEQGHKHDMHILSHEICPADGHIASRFMVAEGTELAFVCIRHEKDGLPILLERRWVNASRVPDFMEANFSVESTYKYLMKRLPLEKVEHKVRAVLADKSLRQLMRLKHDDACLMLRRRTWSKGEIVSCADLIYVGTRYELTGVFIP
ncbi:MAG: histidine utilization repressor [Robiginitomaculum sp.]|nr:MAG: histidine utilization repressor [Robiginitomaculum sp.]